MVQSGVPAPPGDLPRDQIDLALRGEATELPGPMAEVEASPMAALGAAGEAAAVRQASLWRDAWRRLIRNRLAVVGMGIVAVFMVLAAFAPLLAPYSEAEVVNYQLKYHKPSWTWPFGLDQNGRDLFSRMMYGARVSLVVGVLAQIIVVLIGVPIGAIAGYYGGRVDNLLMRVVDVAYAIPQVLIVLLMVNMLGSGLRNIFLAIGLVGWVTEARLVRGQFLALREQEYVKASRVAGAGAPYIMIRHLLPNSLTPIIVAVTFGIPSAIFTEAALSFIGVGIRPPTASWGQMVGSGQAFIRSYPHILVFPVAAIGLTMLGFTFLGDGLRDALDPKAND